MTFDFEFDRDAGEVTVVHSSGDTLDGDNTASLAAEVGESATEWPLPVQVGDDITVEADPGDAVDVVWRGPDGASATLESYPVPDRAARPRCTGEGTDPDGPVPQVSLDFRYDDGTVSIVHGGGDSLTLDNTDHVEVRVDGREATTWELPVSAGRRVTVEASPGATVTVVWYSRDCETAVLGRFEVP